MHSLVKSYMPENSYLRGALRNLPTGEGETQRVYKDSKNAESVLSKSLLRSGELATSLAKSPIAQTI